MITRPRPELSDKLLQRAFDEINVSKHDPSATACGDRHHKPSQTNAARRIS
jgi:hypothetical protein